MPEFSSRVLHPKDLLALKYVHDASLSPDSHRIAYVTSRSVEDTEEETFEITIEELATGSKWRLDFSRCVTSPRWSPDGTRLAFIAIENGWSRLYISDMKGRNITALTPNGCQVRGPPAWSPDGFTVAYTVAQHQRSDGTQRITKRIFRADGLGFIDQLTLTIHLVDVLLGVSRSLSVGRAVAIHPSFSPCGRHILFLGSEAAGGYPPLDLRPFTIDLDDGRVVEVLGDPWYVAAAAWSPCGKRIVIAGDYDSPLTVPTAGLWVVNRDGSNPQCRTEGLGGCLGVHVHHDMPTWATVIANYFVVPDANHAYATVTTGGCAAIWRISLDGPVRCEPVASGLRTCVILDASAQSSHVLYAVSNLYTPWDLYLIDLKRDEETRLTSLNHDVLTRWPDLKVEHLKYESSDGLALEGWHLTRADRSGSQPTIMFIHGGPELVTGHAFRFDFHLLAANGYAILFANFRGSSGYGEAFRQALRGDWGARGFPDHMATVDAAIARGLADVARLGVWGPSHGGFATCWIVGHTSRFRAAVAESAVTNFATLYYLSDLPDAFARELGGRPDEIPGIYASRSPLTYASQCRTPTLLLHGADDLRCSIVEAEQFYRALHDVGCKSELVRVAGMSHMGDSTGPLSARVAQNEALLEWFERHL